MLTVIMKSHMKALMAQKEEHDELIDELQSTSGGGYARQMISRVLTSYKESGLTSDDPF